jgi:hypothetical protein
MICVAILLILFLIVCALVSSFTSVWFIIGNVWVFSNANTVQYTNASSDTYCDRTLYLFAFWSIIATYISGVLTCFCSCFSSLCAPLLTACGVGAASKASSSFDSPGAAMSSTDV